jgi:hypothetical protein
MNQHTHPGTSATQCDQQRDESESSGSSKVGQTGCDTAQKLAISDLGRNEWVHVQRAHEGSVPPWHLGLSAASAAVCSAFNKTRPQLRDCHIQRQHVCSGVHAHHLVTQGSLMQKVLSASYVQTTQIHTHPNPYSQ